MSDSFRCYRVRVVLASVIRDSSMSDSFLSYRYRKRPTKNKAEYQKAYDEYDRDLPTMTVSVHVVVPSKIAEEQSYELQILSTLKYSFLS